MSIDSLALTERERVLGAALLRLLRASGSDVTGLDLYADLGIDPPFLASAPRPFAQGVHDRGRFPAGSGFTLEVIDASDSGHSLVGRRGTHCLRPAADPARRPGLIAALHVAAWLLFDREPRAAGRGVGILAFGVALALSHVILTGPWVAEIGRAVIGGIR